MVIQRAVTRGGLNPGPRPPCFSAPVREEVESMKIAHAGQHHLVMRKALGLPRKAPGMHLARQCEGQACPDQYVGYAQRRGMLQLYLLCGNPQHYRLVRGRAHTRPDQLVRKQELSALLQKGAVAPGENMRMCIEEMVRAARDYADGLENALAFM